ncbi:integrase arm-type DNA-binding domain-containing protein [Rhizobium bangladeshense]|nr:integrase arm-type DNA-binding domain-containing protein [Rhizobium bangladeshense]
MRKNLTDAAVKAIKPDPTKRLEISDVRVPALKLQVTPAGAKTWVLRYRLGAQIKKFTIGRVEAVTLAEAREQADAALKLVKQSIDPGAAKKADAEEKKARNDNLVEVAFAAFITKHVKTLKSADELERIINKEIVPVWRGRRVEDIRKRDVLALLDAVAERGSATMANRLLAHVRAAFNWFISRDYKGVDFNPCTGVKPVVAEVQRDRVLTDVEMRLVLRAAVRMGYPWNGVVRLLAFTGVRRDEAAHAPKTEFALDIVPAPVWLIPKERTKNGRPHLVPLAPSVVEFLKTLDTVEKSSFVFTTTGETPVSGYGKAKERLDRIMLDIAREDAVAAGEEPEDATLAEWRFHDLRRTCATGMAALGIAPHIIEACLNHVSGAKASVAGIYNRFSYEAEKRHALAAWAQHLQSIESIRTDEKIIPFQVQG